MNKIISDTINKLSQAEGFRDVCHECGTKDSMPSTDILREIVQISRSILFPGYFGDPEVNEQTMKYHIAVNVEQLAEIDEAMKNHDGKLMVGFNRRFSKPFLEIADFFKARKIGRAHV